MLLQKLFQAKMNNEQLHNQEQDPIQRDVQSESSRVRGRWEAIRQGISTAVDELRAKVEQLRPSVEQLDDISAINQVIAEQGDEVRKELDELAQLETLSDMEGGERLDPTHKVEVLAHRAGWTKTGEQNSVATARETFKQVEGGEIDIEFTADGVAVINHKSAVRKLTLEQFKERYPNHGTLEGWVDWMESDPQMAEKKFYLDLKGTEQDPYRLIEQLRSVGERMRIGSKDPRTVMLLLEARSLLCEEDKGPEIYLQVPDPMPPSAGVKNAAHLAEYVGLGENLEAMTDEEKERVSKMRPDGLHFFFHENLAKEIVSEAAGHGEYHPVSDENPSETSTPFPNIPIAYNLQQWRIKRFVEQAKKAGFKVAAGSSGSAESLERMITQWNVDIVMPNNPEEIPQSQQEIQAEKVATTQDIGLPRDQYKNEHGSRLKEGDLQKELEELVRSREDPKRVQYLIFALKVKTTNPIRQQFGI